MIKNIGDKIHLENSSNHINEVIDGFNVLNSGSSGGDSSAPTQIVILATRMHASLVSETVVQANNGAFALGATEEDVTLKKVVYANLTMSLQTAKALHGALGQAIENVDPAAHVAPGNAI